MTVIVDLQVPADEFELGQVLTMTVGSTIELETMVPIGEVAVPFFWVYEQDDDTFEKHIRTQASVEDLTLVQTHDGRSLYSLEWRVDRDRFFHGLTEAGAQLLSATGTPETWQFELRFPTNEALASFQQRCHDAGIHLDVQGVYNPTKPGAGPWFGVSDVQRETLVLAAERGYFQVPRECSAADLAVELGISDQAVSERIRRGVLAFVSNALMSSEANETPAVSDGGQ